MRYKQHSERDISHTERFPQVFRANGPNLRCDSGKSYEHSILHKLSYTLTKERRLPQLVAFVDTIWP